MWNVKFILFSLLIFFANIASASTIPPEDDTKDIAGTLFHHVSNGNELELFPYLPPVHLPYGVTVHGCMLLLSSMIILAFFIPVARRKSLKPKTLGVMIESVVLFIRDDIVYPVMGEKRGDAWLPFFITLFMFIVTINYVGLIPAFKSATGNINVTSALALMILLIIFIAGFMQIGIKRFFKNMYPEGVPKFIGVSVVLLEFFGLFIKCGVLSVRLFANMFAGHLVILSFILMIFLLSPYFSLVSVPFAVFSFLLDILVALIQAFVFTLLSCVFINMAVSSEH